MPVDPARAKAGSKGGRAADARRLARLTKRQRDDLLDGAVRNLGRWLVAQGWTVDVAGPTRVERLPDGRYRVVVEFTGAEPGRGTVTEGEDDG